MRHTPVAPHEELPLPVRDAWRLVASLWAILDGGDDAPAGSRLLWRQTVLLGAVFSLAALVVVGPHVLSVSRVSTVSYDWRDFHIFAWNFWHAKEALAGPESLFSTALIFHPTGTSLALHSNPLPYSLLSIPFQILSPTCTGLVVAYHTIIFLSFIGCAFSAYWLCVLLTGERRMSILAALLFSLCPYRIANLARLHLLAMEFIPLVLLCLVLLVRQPTRLRVFFLSVSAALLYTSSPEYALYICPLAVAWLGCSCWGMDRKRLRRVLSHVGVSALLSAVLCSPLLVQQVAVAFFDRSPWHQNSAMTVDAFSEGSSAEADIWNPALLSFVVPSRLHPVLGRWVHTLGQYEDGVTRGMRSETSLSLVCLILCALALATRALPRAGRLWLLVALCYGVLCLGPHLRLTGTVTTQIPLPFLWLHRLVPFLRLTRDSARLVPFVVLSLGIATCYAADSLTRRFVPSKWVPVLLLVAVALLVFECVPRGPRSVSVAPHPGLVLLEDLQEGEAVIDLRRWRKLFAQTQHGHPIGAATNSIPRATGTVSIVEQCLQTPQLVLDAPEEVQSARIAQLQRTTRELRFRRAIFPCDSECGPRVELARKMGAEIVLVEDLFFCRLY
ncbi:MAG: hypothetical protein KAI66_06840 [Lentisphaeria bacterium]|nr:hypothetical protein [Lentisphaeria bacterium]